MHAVNPFSFALKGIFDMKKSKSLAQTLRVLMTVHPLWDARSESLLLRFEGELKISF